MKNKRIFESKDLRIEHKIPKNLPERYLIIVPYEDSEYGECLADYTMSKKELIMMAEAILTYFNPYIKKDGRTQSERTTEYEELPSPSKNVFWS